MASSGISITGTSRSVKAAELELVNHAEGHGKVLLVETPARGLGIRDLPHAGLACERIRHDRVHGARVHERAWTGLSLTLAGTRTSSKPRMSNSTLDCALRAAAPGIDVDVHHRGEEIQKPGHQPVAVPHGALRRTRVRNGSRSRRSSPARAPIRSPPGATSCLPGRVPARGGAKRVVVSAGEEHSAVQGELGGVLLQLLSGKALEVTLKLQKVASLQSLLRVGEQLGSADVVLGKDEDVRTRKRPPCTPPPHEQGRSQSARDPARRRALRDSERASSARSANPSRIAAASLGSALRLREAGSRCVESLESLRLPLKHAFAISRLGDEEKVHPGIRHALEGDPDGCTARSRASSRTTPPERWFRHPSLHPPERLLTAARCRAADGCAAVVTCPGV